jgi:hypothetical protein
VTDPTPRPKSSAAAIWLASMVALVIVSVIAVLITTTVRHKHAKADYCEKYALEVARAIADLSLDDPGVMDEIRDLRAARDAACPDYA